jgi:hypothetical protein
MFKNRHTMIYLVLAVLLGVTLACGSSTNPGGQVVSTTGNQSAPTVAQTQINKIGDVIQTGSQYITLNSAQITGGTLQANFTIENKGADSLIISSMISFEAKSSDGTKLNLDIFDCPSGSLDGTVLAGDKLKGNICWSGLTTTSAKIYYTPNFMGSTVIVWEVK